jgi:hypothetical protein
MSNPKFTYHKALTVLVGANIALDIIAILIWGINPQTQWSIYRLGFTIVGAEAAVAAGFFSVTLFGLIKKRKWAPKLAIAITIAQRVFGTYVFFPSLAILITLTWSLIIIFVAYQTIKHNQ